ncbi:intermediate conductance calcium-activated potassium channel protein 4-like, partial [Numida meleagris]|uniref:intermediate conductance calcium-activated potassium channel protein 4-like n=1 Tax=Numida meleagris TaxID=8996 RepID=UPI000B3DE066
MLDTGAQDWRVALTPRRALWAVLEMGLCALHPGVRGLPGAPCPPPPGPWRRALALAMLGRLALAPRALLATPGPAPAFRSLGAMGAVAVGGPFALRALLWRHPTRALLGAAGAAWVLGAWLLAACERWVLWGPAGSWGALWGLYRVSMGAGGESVGICGFLGGSMWVGHLWENYGFLGGSVGSLWGPHGGSVGLYGNLHCLPPLPHREAPEGRWDLSAGLWLVPVTFLTVGYGDTVPRTACGRLVCLATGVMGVCCTALLVAVAARHLEFTRAERALHGLVLGARSHKQVRARAARVLQSAWRLHRAPPVAPGRWRLERRLLAAIEGFRYARRQHRRLQEEAE